MNKKVSYWKQIAHQHWWSTMEEFCSHLDCSPHKIWLFFLIPCARMYEIPKMLGRWDAAPLGREHGWLLETRFSPECYHITFRRPRLNRCGVGRGSKKLEDAGAWHAPSLGMGRVRPLETHSCPTCVTTPNFIALGQTVWALPDNSDQTDRQISIRVLQFGERWSPAPFGWGRGWPLEICFFPPVLPRQFRSF